jgi:hypothetical protein
LPHAHSFVEKKNMPSLRELVWALYDMCFYGPSDPSATPPRDAHVASRGPTACLSDAEVERALEEVLTRCVGMPDVGDDDVQAQRIAVAVRHYARYRTEVFHPKMRACDAEAVRCFFNS